MKNKNLYGNPLTEQEMKKVMGGYVFSYSEHGRRCPACGEWVELGTYSYYIVCNHCGGVITLEEKNEE